MIQRYQIEALIKEQVSLNSIAKAIGVHCSTIGREIKRNRLDNGEYIARYAPPLYHFIQSKEYF